jgi:hypothetical protein
MRKLPLCVKERIEFIARHRVVRPEQLHNIQFERIEHPRQQDHHGAPPLSGCDSTLEAPPNE